MLDDHEDTSAPAASTGSSEAATTPPAKKAARKRTTKKAAPAAAGETGTGTTADTADAAAEKPKKAAAKKAATKKTTTKKSAGAGSAKKATAKKSAGADDSAQADADAGPKKSSKKKATAAKTADGDDGLPSPAPLFQAPDTQAAAPTRRTTKKAASTKATTKDTVASDGPTDESGSGTQGGDAADGADADTGETPARRKRRRGGRRRRKPGGEGGEGQDQSDQADGDGGSDASADDSSSGESTSSRRRRRRRRAGEDDGNGSDDPANTVTKVRSGRSAADEITAVSGSTRLEAKKQRRREGREAGRRRAPIVSEAEFLARRESVNRVMVIRQREDLTQIGVLEDNVLVEHYVARESQTSLIGNVYLGRVQNVLPSMEAAFIDIGKGRNAVLYAGEVNWSALGHKDGQPRKIESVLSSGQTVLVQVTKDPIGHKGARLTSQVSLAGRFLVYVPDGTTSGISRKLPDTERNRLKTLLKEIVPEQAGVIVRTAAEGASEDELTRDVERLTSRWDAIEKKAKGNAPQLLYGEPDLTLKVVRDLFTEDFTKLVIEGDEAWDTVQGYVVQVAPDLEDRLERYEPKKNQDIFAAYRIDEQIKKGLERKVWLPSGGSLIIDRTEAMTVVDVNTGKFTGSGGNLEETVTKNNLEAAEEIVRQLRLRDIGGIIVVDFIDMVLESNRDLVLRRLVECLGRDRTRHQVAEVTSLGLVQMTRKRIGTGLLESFSHDCQQCHGRGVVVEDAPVEPKKADEEPRRARRSRGRGRASESTDAEPPKAPSPKDIAAMARHHDEHHDVDEHDEDVPGEEPRDEDLNDEDLNDEDLNDEDLNDEATAGGEETTISSDDLADDPADTPAATTEETAPETQPEPEPEPADETPAEPEPAPPAEPEKPRVVTRSRRRSASRPAGPPASANGTSGGGAGDAGETPVEQAADGVPALHVPVKRKGARKR
jgi:ribonuclease E